MQKIKLKDVLVVKKKSRLEVEAKKLELDYKKVIYEDPKTLARLSRVYSHNPEFIKKQIDSTRTLYSFVKYLLEIGFKPNQIIEREELDNEWIKDKKVILALGGDDHLIWVLDRLEFLKLDMPVIACNADIKRSRGHILYYNIGNIKQILDDCAKGAYEIEKWPKIEGEIVYDGKKIKLFPASQEYVIGEYAGSQCSTQFLIDGNKKELQKGDRLIITNGAGSSGWYDTIHKTIFGGSDTYKNSEKKIRYIVDGPSGGKERYKFLKGEVKCGDVLEIVSYNDSRGVAITDGLDDERFTFSFPMGSLARIWCSKNKVSKIIKNKSFKY